MMQDERKFKGGMWDGQELAGSRKFVCLILARWEQLSCKYLCQPRVGKSYVRISE